MSSAASASAGEAIAYTPASPLPISATAWPAPGLGHRRTGPLLLRARAPTPAPGCPAAAGRGSASTYWSRPTTHRSPAQLRRRARRQQVARARAEPDDREPPARAAGAPPRRWPWRAALPTSAWARGVRPRPAQQRRRLRHRGGAEGGERRLRGVRDVDLRQLGRRSRSRSGTPSRAAAPSDPARPPWRRRWPARRREAADSPPPRSASSTSPSTSAAGAPRRGAHAHHQGRRPEHRLRSRPAPPRGR